MKSTNSNRSSSVQSAPAWRMNTAVSATVTGRVRICAMYANGAYFQDGHRSRRPRDGPPEPSTRGSFMIHVRRGDRLGLCETVLTLMAKAAAPGSGAPAMSWHRACPPVPLRFYR